MYEVKFAPNAISAIKSLIYDKAEPSVKSSMRLTLAGDNVWPAGSTFTINKDLSSSSSSNGGSTPNMCTLYPTLFDPLVIDLPDISGVVLEQEYKEWQTQEVVVEQGVVSSSSSSSTSAQSNLYSIALPSTRIANSKVTVISLFDGSLLQPGYDYDLNETTNSIDFLRTLFNDTTVRIGYFLLVPQSRETSTNEALQKTVQMVINVINQNILTLGILASRVKENPYQIFLESIYPNGDCIYVEGVGTLGRILINGANTLGPIFFSGFVTNERSYAVGTMIPTEEYKYIKGVAGTSIPTSSPKIYFDQDFESLTLEQARDIGEYIEKGILQVDHTNADGSFDATLTADDIYEMARGVVIIP